MKTISSISLSTTTSSVTTIERFSHRQRCGWMGMVSATPETRETPKPKQTIGSLDVKIMKPIDSKVKVLLTALAAAILLDLLRGWPWAQRVAEKLKEENPK